VGAREGGREGGRKRRRSVTCRFLLKFEGGREGGREGVRTRRRGNAVESTEVGMTQTTDNVSFPLKVVDETLVLLTAFFGGLEGGEGGRGVVLDCMHMAKCSVHGGRKGGREWGKEGATTYLDHLDSYQASVPRGPPKAAWMPAAHHWNGRKRIRWQKREREDACEYYDT